MSTFSVFAESNNNLICYIMRDLGSNGNEFLSDYKYSRYVDVLSINDEVRNIVYLEIFEFSERFAANSFYLQEQYPSKYLEDYEKSTGIRLEQFYDGDFVVELRTTKNLSVIDKRTHLNQFELSAFKDDYLSMNSLKRNYEDMGYYCEIDKVVDNIVKNELSSNDIFVMFLLFALIVFITKFHRSMFTTISSSIKRCTNLFRRTKQTVGKVQRSEMNSFSSLVETSTIQEDNDCIIQEKSGSENFAKIEEHYKTKVSEKLDDNKTSARKMLLRNKWWILIVILVSAVLVTKMFWTEIQGSIRYNEAMRSFTQGNYEESMKKFDILENFKDSKYMLQISKYKYAESLLESKKYREAIELFTDLSGFENSETYLNESIYMYAVSLFNSDLVEVSIEYFEKIEDYKDSLDYILEYDSNIFFNIDESEAENLIDYWDLKGDAKKEAFVKKLDSVYLVIFRNEMESAKYYSFHNSGIAFFQNNTGVSYKSTMNIGILSRELKVAGISYEELEMKIRYLPYFASGKWATNDGLNEILLTMDGEFSLVSLKGNFLKDTSFYSFGLLIDKNGSSEFSHSINDPKVETKFLTNKELEVTIILNRSVKRYRFYKID